MTEYSVPVPSATSPICPKNIGEILNRTYRLMRAHFGLLIGIGAAPSLLLLLVIAALEAILFAPVIAQWPHPSPDAMLHSLTPAVILPVILLVTILSIAIFAIYMAASCYASAKADSGIKVTFRQAYKIAIDHAGRHSWLLVWIYLRAFLPVLVIYISIAGGIGVLVLAKPNPNPVMFFLLLLGFLLLIPAFIYGILVMLRLSLAFPACVEEGLSARDAIQRSCWLTQGAKGRIFLVMLVLHAAIYAIIMALELISMLLVAIGMLVVSTLSIHLQAPGSYIGIGLGVVCLLAMMVLWMALTYAAITTALAVLYNDQRLRKDSALPVLPLYGAQPPFLPTLEPNS